MFGQPALYGIVKVLAVQMIIVRGLDLAVESDKSIGYCDYR